MPIDRTSHLVSADPKDNVKRRSFYRRFIQFLFSNLGLVLLVIGYSIGGAFLFQLLEQYIELQNCQQASLSESINVSNMSESMYQNVHLKQENTTQLHDRIEIYLINFTKEIYQRRTSLRFTGQNCTNTSSWNFPSALLFAITVITTIGFGHVTPVSWEGQITCICYALIGIPIFLLCLANISSVLGDIFRFMYAGLLRCVCCLCRTYTRNRRRVKRRTNAGKNKPKDEIDYIGTASIDPSWPEAMRTAEDKYSDEEYDEEEDDDIWDHLEGRVPFGAVILIIIGYICLGAFMFNRFEKWTMIQSVYFCFVTLATMGFGDFVPGITSGETSSLRFLLASLYILFGLAILAMCFDLIKEGIVDKVHWIANKLGIIADDDDQIDDERTRYANFEYDTTANQQIDNSNNRQTSGKKKSIDSYGEPPAYDSKTNNKWMKAVRDKKDIDRKKAVTIKDEKH